MDKIKTTEGDLLVRDARFALVASRFNDFIVESLLKGAVHALKQHGAAEADIEIVRVPGAFDSQSSGNTCMSAASKGRSVRPLRNTV